VTIGKRGADALTRAGIETAADFSPVPDNVRFSDVSPLTTYAVRQFTDHHVDRVGIVSTHFVSTLNQVPVVKWVMPLGHELIAFVQKMHHDAVRHPERFENPGAEPLFEPSIREISTRSSRASPRSRCTSPCSKRRRASTPPAWSP